MWSVIREGHEETLVPPPGGGSRDEVSQNCEDGPWVQSLGTHCPGDTQLPPTPAPASGLWVNRLPMAGRGSEVPSEPSHPRSQGPVGRGQSLAQTLAHWVAVGTAASVGASLHLSCVWGCDVLTTDINPSPSRPKFSWLRPSLGQIGVLAEQIGALSESIWPRMKWDLSQCPVLLGRGGVMSQSWVRSVTAETNRRGRETHGLLSAPGLKTVVSSTSLSWDTVFGIPKPPFKKSAHPETSTGRGRVQVSPRGTGPVGPSLAVMTFKAPDQWARPSWAYETSTDTTWIPSRGPSGDHGEQNHPGESFCS